MPRHSSSDGFHDGVPGLCNECFLKQTPSKKYYCVHNQRFAVLSAGAWETFGDVVNEPAKRATLDTSIYSWRGYGNWANKVRQAWNAEEPVDS